MPIQLEVPPTLEKKLRDAGLTHEDVREVVAYCEASGDKKRNLQTGRYYGSKALTGKDKVCWVEYSAGDDGLRLEDVYGRKG